MKMLWDTCNSPVQIILEKKQDQSLIHTKVATFTPTSKSFMITLEMMIILRQTFLQQKQDLNMSPWIWCSHNGKMVLNMKLFQVTGMRLTMECIGAMMISPLEVLQHAQMTMVDGSSGTHMMTDPDTGNSTTLIKLEQKRFKICMKEVFYLVMTLIVITKMELQTNALTSGILKRVLMATKSVSNTLEIQMTWVSLMRHGGSKLEDTKTSSLMAIISKVNHGLDYFIL